MASSFLCISDLAQDERLELLTVSQLIVRKQALPISALMCNVAPDADAPEGWDRMLMCARCCGAIRGVVCHAGCGKFLHYGCQADLERLRTESVQKKHRLHERRIAHAERWSGTRIKALNKQTVESG